MQKREKRRSLWRKSLSFAVAMAVALTALPVNALAAESAQQVEAEAVADSSIAVHDYGKSGDDPATSEDESARVANEDVFKSAQYQESTKYRLTANGTLVSVYKYQKQEEPGRFYHMDVARFSSEDAQPTFTVTLEDGTTIERVTVYPERYYPQDAFQISEDKKTLTFRMAEELRYCIVSINGTENNLEGKPQLAIINDPAEVDKPDVNGENVLDFKAFSDQYLEEHPITDKVGEMCRPAGSVTDTSLNNGVEYTWEYGNGVYQDYWDAQVKFPNKRARLPYDVSDAFQAALEEVRSSDVLDTIYFPAGTYVWSGLSIKNWDGNGADGPLTIYTDEDALLVNRMQECQEAMEPAIGIWDSSNITVSGRGIFDGQGTYAKHTDKCDADKSGHQGGCMLVRSENITFNDTYVRDVKQWNWECHTVKNVTYNNIKGLSPFQHSWVDGLDLTSGKNVTVNGAITMGNDDTFASGHFNPSDEFPRRKLQGKDMGALTDEDKNAAAAAAIYNKDRLNWDQDDSENFEVNDTLGWSTYANAIRLGHNTRWKADGGSYQMKNYTFNNVNTLHVTGWSPNLGGGALSIQNGTNNCYPNYQSLVFNNCSFTANNGSSAIFPNSSNFTDFYPENVTLKNCWFKDANTPVEFRKIKNVLVEDLYLGGKLVEYTSQVKLKLGEGDQAVDNFTFLANGKPVTENELPVFTNPAENLQAYAGNPMIFYLKAEDADGDEIHFGDVDVSAMKGASFDKASGKFSWIPSDEEIGKSYGVTFTASDYTNQPVAYTVTITVASPANSAQRFGVSEDAHLQSWKTEKNNNYGVSRYLTTLLIPNSGEMGENFTNTSTGDGTDGKIIYLKFDLTGLKKYKGLYDKAELMLTYINKRYNSNNGENDTVKVAAVEDSSWNENEITWNTKPVFDVSSIVESNAFNLGISNKDKPGADNEAINGARAKLDVTDFVTKAIEAGKDALTLAVCETRGIETYFVSKEGAEQMKTASSDMEPSLLLNLPVAVDLEGPSGMTVTEGYEATDSDSFALKGKGPFAVTLSGENNNGKITWNEDTQQIHVAPGLADGTYTVKLTAKNADNAEKTVSFVLTVLDDPSIPDVPEESGDKVLEGTEPNCETINFKEYNDKENAMYDVVGRNRMDAHTDAVIPYQDEQTALVSTDAYAKENSDYIQMLTGEDAVNTWRLTVVKNVAAADEAGLTGEKATQNAFAAVDYDDTGAGWKEVFLPMSWTMQGDWDYAIYKNNKMPWQEDEKPYGSKPTSFLGTLTPGEAPVTYNPVGFYRTKFTVKDSLKAEGNRIRISFQGVESAYYVFVNGQAVGYSEDSFRGHEFDITDYLVDGENTLAVRVHKFSDSTWLEDQDMIYDGGIFRDVYLISVPEVSIEDYKVETDFDKDFVDANLIIRELTLKNNTANSVPAGYQVTVRLYNNAEDTEPVTVMNVTTKEEIPAYGKYVFKSASAEIKKPRQWSAEKPELYLLSLNAYKPDATEAYVHTAQLLGFREISFTRTVTDKNGRNITESYDRICINGQPLLMKGVNRHDTDPTTGKYVSKEVYETDVELMKQYNINTVRTSHYSNDEYLYYLADKYGLYIMAEANAECHGLASGGARDSYGYYGRELRRIFEDRTISSYQTLKNHSAVVTWSIGNECGSTSGAAADVKEVFNWMVKYYHDRDNTRFVHSEFMQEDTSVDLKSNMYPSFGFVQNWAVTPDEPGTSANPKGMPYFLCEYAHAMGNAAGSLSDYWDAIRSGTNMIGACVWDWVDQARIVPLANVTGTGTTSTGKTKVENPWDYYSEEDAYLYLYKEAVKGQKVFFGYGGDYGDVNNDNDFCVNGLVSPDRQPQPEIYELKYQYQGFWMVETPTYEQQQLKGWTTKEDLEKKQVVVYNENNFTNLNEFNIKWSLKEDGKVIDSGLLEELPSVEPKASGAVSIPFTMPETKMAGAKYYLDIEIVTKAAGEVLKAGHEVAHEQFELPEEVAEAKGADAGGNGLNVTETDESFNVTGKIFSFSLKKANGILENYVYNGETVIEEGPRPNFWRAPHNNDGNLNGNWRYAGQDDSITMDKDSISVQEAEDGRQVIDFAMNLVVGGESAKQLVRYIVDESGSVEVRMALDTGSMTEASILKIGTQMTLPGDYENVTWYGNGYTLGEDGEYGYKYPVPEGYSDRSTFAVQGIFHTTVSDMFFPHIRTQESGTVNGVNWISIESESKNTAILVSGEQQLEASALHWSAEQMNNIRHPYEFQGTTENTYLNVDFASRGIGNNSCGPDVLPQYRLEGGRVYRYAYTIIPTEKSDADAYGALSRSWNAVADTGVDEPKIPKAIGFIGAVKQGGTFPTAVTVDGIEKEVVWEKAPKDLESYELAEVIGSIDGGSTLISARFEIVPEGLVYYVDCNDFSDTSAFEKVKEAVPELKNQVTDQRWSDGELWGITSAAANYGSPKHELTKPGNKYMTGYYLQGANTIDYMFTLEAGTYVLSAGFNEFWPNNSARQMAVSVMDADGKVLGESGASLAGREGKLQDKSEFTFEVTKAGRVTFRLSKISGADPLLSWVALAKQESSEVDSREELLEEAALVQAEADRASASALDAKAEADAVTEEADEAQRVAAEARISADAAEERAEAAQEAAVKAREAAEEAASAGESSEAAQDAAKKAETAEEAARASAKAAKDAILQAEAAQEAAKTAQDKAEAAQKAAQTAKDGAETAEAEAKAAGKAAADTSLDVAVAAQQIAASKIKAEDAAKAVGEAKMAIAVLKENAAEAVELARAEKKAAKDSELAAVSNTQVAELARDAAQNAAEWAKAEKKTDEEAKRKAEEILKQAQEEADAKSAEAKETLRKAEKLLARAEFLSTKVSLKAVNSPAKKTVKVSWKRVSEANGYVIQYATNAQFRGAKKVNIKNGATLQKKIKKLKSRKKYYVRVKAYRNLDGVKLYTQYSNRKAVKVK